VDALPALRPVGEVYARLPIATAFNWGEAAESLGDGDWYLVAFRSIRRDDADEARLELYDDLAHADAAAAPGFIHYFKGPKATDGSCLSFCLWETRADARAAAGRPAHVEAVSLIDEMYSLYTLEFHRVQREAGGALTFTPYDAPHQSHLPVPEPAPLRPIFGPAAAS
jgi:hypothetical protein